MSDRITPELQTAKIAEACYRMKQAETRMERERILEELARLVRTPTSRAMYVEGL